MKGEMRPEENKKKWIRLMTKGIALLVIVVGSFLFWKTSFYDPYSWERHWEAGTAEYKNGNYPEAEKHFLAALRETEKFAPNDPHLHSTLNNLVEFYRAQSKYAEAEIIIKRILALDEGLLGPDHPNVGASLNNLAENYRSQNKYDEAETAYKKALAIFEKKLGPNDFLVVHIRERYLSLLREIGRIEEAENYEARIRTHQKTPNQGNSSKE